MKSSQKPKQKSDTYASKIKKTKGDLKSGYSGKLHKKIAEPEEELSDHDKQKNLMKKEIQSNAIREHSVEAAHERGSLSKKFIDKTEDIPGMIGEAVSEKAEFNLGTILLVALFLLMVPSLFSALSSCSSMAQCGNGAIIGTSYTAKDEDILAVDETYSNMESDLRLRMSSISSDYPGYDEYDTDIADIGHGSYKLAALLTILYDDYSQSAGNNALQGIFDAQYEFTAYEEIQTRTRTVTESEWVWDTPTSGHTETSTHEEEYEYKILHARLTNAGIEAAVDDAGLSDDDLERYNLLVTLKGNRPELFD